VSTAIVRIVVTDSNVLINLMHVSRLDFCGRLPGHEFVVPDRVREEINDPDSTAYSRCGAQRRNAQTRVDHRARLLFNLASVSRIASVVFNTVSGLSEMLSMPCSTRNCANSG